LVTSAKILFVVPNFVAETKPFFFCVAVAAYALVVKGVPWILALLTLAVAAKKLTRATK